MPEGFHQGGKDKDIRLSVESERLRAVKGADELNPRRNTCLPRQGQIISKGRGPGRILPGRIRRSLQQKFPPSIPIEESYGLQEGRQIFVLRVEGNKDQTDY